MAEFDRRFSQNENLYNCFSCFDKTSPFFLKEENLITFLNHYKYTRLIDTDLLSSQLCISRNYLNKRLGNQSSCLIEMVEYLKETPLAYSEVIKVIEIVLTIPISTASNERFFFANIKRMRAQVSEEVISNYIEQLTPELHVNAHWTKKRTLYFPTSDE